MVQANEKLRGLMKKTGVTQTQLGKTLRIKQPTVSLKLQEELTPEESERFRLAILETASRIYGEV